ncbi:MAG TPA: DUF1223 domain-containing protein [Candidatus Acidoferrales bacterium]|nr:DUF1223 domain-containing protein [Candidatus Acidoferrales bacterium]
MRNLSGVTFKASVAIIGLCAAFVLPAGAQTQAPAQAPAQAASSSANSTSKPVLVELFTAEGCSDCPRAEELAKRMETEPLRGINLIVLEEHVDYWNKYGWIDPFSSGDWTARQLEYVGKTPKPDPYTPEMVIDGGAQFPGGDGRQAQAAINAAAAAPETNLSVTQESLDAKGEGEFKISAGRLEGDAPGDPVEVWIAVTEDGLSSAVKAGENAGHTLYHAAVLRYLHKVGAAQGSGDAAFTGDAKVKINSKWNRKDVNVVVFLQDKKSMKVLGVASTKLTS